MKLKSTAFIALIFLSACQSAPQVTATSEVTVTLLPASPTPEATSTPEPTITPTAETVTIGGVTLTYGEDGLVTNMSVEGNYTDAQKAEKMVAVDPTQWGFEEGQAQLVVDGPYRYITPASDPETKIAKWNAGTNEWEWDWEVMDGLEGGNPLFRIAKTVKMNGSSPADMTSAKSESAKIAEFARLEVENLTNTVRRPVYVYEGDSKNSPILGYLIQLNVSNTENLPVLPSNYTEVLDGYLCFLSKRGVVKIWLDDVKIYGRSFN